MLQRSLVRSAQRGFAHRNIAASQRFFSMKIYGPSGEFAHAIFDACVTKPEVAEGEKAEPWSKADLKKVSAGLGSFAEYYQDNASLREFLLDTDMSAEDKHAALAENVYPEIGLGASNEDGAVMDSVVMMMQENKLDLLDDVVGDFNALVADANNEVTCTVTSAVALNSSQCQQLEAKIKSTIEKGKKPLISFVVDSTLLGGLTVDVGGKFQDLSARSAIVQGAEALRTL